MAKNSPSTDFERALQFTLRWEGGFTNDPDDHGGATNFGITQATYNGWLRSKEFPAKSVRTITVNEASEIYRFRYWVACGADRMAWPLNFVMFDLAVNSGPGRAKEFLSRAKKFMDKNPANDTVELAARIIEYRTQFFYNIVKANPSQKKFLQGWLNRVRDLRLAAFHPEAR